MAVRYTSTFKAEKSITWRVDFEDKGFGGASASSDLAAPGFTLNYDGQGDDRWQPIKASTCTVHLMVNSAGEKAFINLINATQEERFFVTIYKDTVIYWAGYIITDTNTEENLSYPYQVDIEAIDGLSRLREIEYNNAGTLYTGSQNFIEHLTQILTKLEIVDFWGATDDWMLTAVDWWEDNMPARAAGEDPLILTRVDNKVFYGEYDDVDGYEGLICYDVLVQILSRFNCRICLSDGMFQIIQVNEYIGAIFQSRVYDKTGTLQSSDGATDYRKTVDQSAIAVLGGSAFENYPPLRELRVRYNFGETTNLLAGHYNGTDIHDYDPAVNVGVVPFQTAARYPAGYRINVYCTILQEFVKAAAATVAYAFYPKFEMYMNIGIYYLKGTYGVDAEWTTTSTDRYIINGIYMGGLLDQYGFQGIFDRYSITTPNTPVSDDLIFGFTLDDTYTDVGNGEIAYNLTAVGTLNYGLYGPSGGEVEKDPGKPLITKIDEFPIKPKLDFNEEQFTYLIKVDKSTIPEISIYGTYGNLNTVKYTDFTNLNTSNGTTPVLSKYEADLPELFMGDGPTSTNEHKLETYDGSSVWADSSTWEEGSTTPALDITDLLLREIMATQKKPIAKIQGTIYGDIDLVSRIAYDSKIWIMNGGTLRADKSEWDGEWFKVAKDTTLLVSSDQPYLANPSETPLAQTSKNKIPGISGLKIKRTIYDSVTLTDDYVPSGAQTSIPITQIGKIVFNTGDKIYIEDLQRGIKHELEINADQAATDNTLTVVSYVFPDNIPASSYIYFSGTERSRMVKHKQEGSIAGLTVTNTEIGESGEPINMDTTDGDIIINGYMRPGKIWHAYGGFEDEEYEQELTTNTWTMITNADNTLWTGSEADGMSLTNDTLTITNAGDYFGTLSFSFLGANRNGYEVRVYNITQSEATFKQGISGFGSLNYAQVTLPFYLENTAGDEYELQIRNISGNNAATYLNGTFFINYLHE